MNDLAGDANLDSTVKYSVALSLVWLIYSSKQEIERKRAPNQRRRRRRRSAN